MYLISLRVSLYSSGDHSLTVRLGAGWTGAAPRSETLVLNLVASDNDLLSRASLRLAGATAFLVAVALARLFGVSGSSVCGRPLFGPPFQVVFIPAVSVRALIGLWGVSPSYLVRYIRLIQASPAPCC